MLRTFAEVEKALKDDLFRAAYGAAWEKIDFESCTFQHIHEMEKPVSIQGWDWSVTFGRCGAVVTFVDGWNGYTWPKLKNT